MPVMILKMPMIVGNMPDLKNAAEAYQANQARHLSRQRRGCRRAIGMRHITSDIEIK